MCEHSWRYCHHNDWNYCVKCYVLDMAPVHRHGWENVVGKTNTWRKVKNGSVVRYGLYKEVWEDIENEMGISWYWEINYDN